MLQQIFSEAFGKFSGIMIERNSLGVKDIPALFLLFLTVGRFSIFPVPYAYVGYLTFDSSLNFPANRIFQTLFQRCLPLPHYAFHLDALPVPISHHVFHAIFRIHLALLIIQKNSQHFSDTFTDLFSSLISNQSSNHCLLGSAWFIPFLPL